ncbi:MAG TPA: potassium channel family protein [Gaiellaceae bacterium]|nr:potassium channel family protein [Gaiellaceae bacterium]
MSKYLRDPPTVGRAVTAIVSATAFIVVASSLLMFLLDHREYPNVGRAVWWSIQTVTTVGYGDVGPEKPVGRVIGSFVMLAGIALVSIVTAVITSTFVTRAQEERRAQLGPTPVQERFERRFDDLEARFDSLEKAVLRATGGGEGAT